ncbi:Fe-Mn family superoxide dismutase [Streptomyces canus]|uniref:Fe-Mn family superoxide dismutase n=1 Tax=Streptomyces canus TaxID=58343 RepID=UPI00384B5D30
MGPCTTAASHKHGVGELADASPNASVRSRVSKRSSPRPRDHRGFGLGGLAHEAPSGRLIVEQAYDHQGDVGQGSTPVLVSDAWEHAFYLHYKNSCSADSLACPPRPARLASHTPDRREHRCGTSWTRSRLGSKW